MAFAELKRLKAKIRRGDATKAEQERYRDLTVQEGDHSERHQARGLSIMDSSHKNDSIILGIPQSIGTKRKFDPVLADGNPCAGNGKWPRMEATPCIDHEAFHSSSLDNGILQTGKPANGPAVAEIPPSLKKPSALLTALRASKATRGQQQHLVKALHASPTTSRMLSRVASARVGLSEESSFCSASNGQHSSSKEPTNMDGRPSAEEEARYHSLTGMQYSAAMMSQALPPSLSVEAFKSNPNMSATHLLRRFGNPHRRVVHQMLREQHERILLDMQRHSQQLRASSSGVDSGGKDDATAMRKYS